MHVEAAEFFARRPVLAGGVLFGVWYLCNFVRRSTRASVHPGATDSEQGELNDVDIKP